MSTVYFPDRMIGYVKIISDFTRNDVNIDNVMESMNRLFPKATLSGSHRVNEENLQRFEAELIDQFSSIYIVNSLIIKENSSADSPKCLTCVAYNHGIPLSRPLQKSLEDFYQDGGDRRDYEFTHDDVTSIPVLEQHLKRFPELEQYIDMVIQNTWNIPRKS